MSESFIKIFITLFTFSHATFFFSILFFYILDYFIDNNNQLRLKYKIQKKKIDWIKYKKTSYFIIKQVITVNIPIGILIALLWEWRGIDNIIYGYLYPIQIIKLIGAILLSDIIFFTGHYIFHIPFFYKRIHKQHHLWSDPAAISTTYAHPIEHIICNIGSVYLPVIIVGLHWKLSLLWIFFGIISVVISHSGYCNIGAERHDLHHLKLNVNYGPFGLCDMIFGTNR